MHKKMGLFSPQFTQFNSIPAFTKVSASQNVHLTFPWNNPEFWVCFFKQEHTFPWRLFFFVTFLFELYTLANRRRVSVDTGGILVRCGSALGRRRWRWVGGLRPAVLSGWRRRPSAGWGLRSCGQRVSGPARTLRRDQRDLQYHRQHPGRMEPAGAEEWWWLAFLFMF